MSGPLWCYTERGLREEIPVRSFTLTRTVLAKQTCVRTVPADWSAEDAMEQAEADGLGWDTEVLAVLGKNSKEKA